MRNRPIIKSGLLSFKTPEKSKLRLGVEWSGVERQAKVVAIMFTLLSLLLMASYFGYVESSQVTSGSELNIFILAGQSNMAGRGGVVDDKWDGIVPPEAQPNPSILRFNAKLIWEEAHEPLHADIDINKTCGIGPGMAFANAVKVMDPRIGVVGLVPCAIGGTNISEWRRGGWLYNELVKRAEFSVREGGRIQAMLWYQGESDTVIREDALSYKVNLEKLFEDLRSDLHLPMLPIIQVALASGNGSFVEVVRHAQLNLNMPNVRCVDAKGMQLQSDELHLATSSQIQLGRMLAETFLKKLKNNRMALFTNVAPTNSIYPYFFVVTPFLAFSMNRIIF